MLGDTLAGSARPPALAVALPLGSARSAGRHCRRRARDCKAAVADQPSDERPPTDAPARRRYAEASSRCQVLLDSVRAPARWSWQTSTIVFCHRIIFGFGFSFQFSFRMTHSRPAIISQSRFRSGLGSSGSAAVNNRRPQNRILSTRRDPKFTRADYNAGLLRPNRIQPPPNSTRVIPKELREKANRETMSLLISRNVLENSNERKKQRPMFQ